MTDVLMSAAQLSSIREVMTKYRSSRDQETKDFLKLLDLLMSHIAAIEDGAGSQIVGYVGVKDGTPYFRKTSDESGDCREISVYPEPDDATARYFNVRRVRLVVDPEPIRAPGDWGSIDG